MKRQHEHDVVAGGQKRLQACEEYSAKERKLHATISAAYAAELERAGMFERWIIQCKIRREVRRERQTFAPDQGLYIQA